MTIPAAAYVSPLVTPNKGIAFIDPKTGVLTDHGYQVTNAIVGFLNGTNRIIPCNASGTNVISLTMLTTSPLIKQYNDFDTFRAVAANTTTGLVTALVVTQQGALGTINVYKTNGSAQATTGDITAGLLYDFTFVDSLNSGAGGLVLR
jgi:hypothetical protein